MNAPKVVADDYIDFLIATPKVCSATEAARVQPDAPDPPRHDAFTRLLTRLEPDPDTLWAESETQVRRDDGVPIVDDSTLDKPYAKAIELVTRHWSGKHRAVGQGIKQYAEFSWAIEHYHRGLKQCTGVERCQCRSAVAQRNHIGLALRAFLRLEIQCFARGVSWVEAKIAIIRDAVRAYLARPRFRLPMPATA
jgi:hypothetical protein